METMGSFKKKKFFQEVRKWCICFYFCLVEGNKSVIERMHCGMWVGDFACVPVHVYTELTVSAGELMGGFLWRFCNSCPTFRLLFMTICVAPCVYST